MGFVPDVIEIETMGGVIAFTVITIILLEMEGEDTQVSLVVKTQVTASEFDRVDEVKAGLFVPAFTEFTRHWYTGVVPPFIDVAENVTGSPAQMLVDPEVIEIVIAGVRTGVTVMVMGLLIAFVGEAQRALETISHVTASFVEKPFSI